MREVTESHLDLISEQNPSVLSCNEDTIKSLLEQAKNEGLPVKSDTNSIGELKMSNGFSYGYFFLFILFQPLDVVEHSYYEEALELLKSRPNIEFSFDVVLEDEIEHEPNRQYENEALETRASQEAVANGTNNFISLSRTNSMQAVSLTRQSSDSIESEEPYKFDPEYNEKESFSLPPIVQQMNRNNEDLEDSLLLNQREDGRTSSMSASSAINNNNANSATYFPKIDSRFLPK